MLDVARRRNLTASEVIERKYFADPDVFEREQRQLFAKLWIAVGHVSEVGSAGDFLTRSIADRPVVVVRNRHGELKAFYNTCQHRGATLAARRKGNCGKGFVCAYHAWSYDLDGNLVGVPSQKHYGEKFDKSQRGLAPVRVETCGGIIFVSLSEDVQPLADYLGDVAPYLERMHADKQALGRVRWTIDANWKIWRENFGDGYHLLYAHQSMGLMVTKYDATLKAFPNGHSVLEHHQSPDGFNPMPFLNAVSQATGRPPEENELFAAFPMPPDPAVDFSAPAYIIGVFPNLGLMETPANQELSIQIAHPDAYNRTIIDEIAMGDPNDSEAMREFRRRYGLAWHSPLGKAEGDDIEIWGRCQKGSAAHEAVPISDLSRGEPGATDGLGIEEHGIRGFYQAWRERMGLPAA